MKRATTPIVCALAGVGLVASQPAFACAFAARFEIDDIKMADVVVTGHVQNYEIKEGFAVLTVRVERPLRGEEYATERVVDFGDEIEVSWQNSTYQLPDDLADERRIFAMRRTGGASPPLRGPSGVLYGDPKGYEYTLLQAPCSPAFMLPYSELGKENIQSILDGDTPLPFDYFNPEWGYIARIRELELLLKIAGGLIVLMIAGISFSLWRSRKRRRSSAE